jgi:hypothetical protein
VTDMAPQQVSLSGVIICPDQELEQRFAVNSFTVACFMQLSRTRCVWVTRSVPWIKWCPDSAVTNSLSLRRLRGVSRNVVLE